MGWVGAWMAGLTGRHGDETLPLYNAVVLRAREPHWYLAGAVPDTVDGRFDMVAAVLTAVLLRMEREPNASAVASARLTERFVEDMDGQLRQLGIGDIVVGKHIGKMMSMLGGRLGAYRDGFATIAGDGGAALGEAIVRNVYRGQVPTPAALDHVRVGLGDLNARLAGVPLATLLGGELP